MGELDPVELLRRQYFQCLAPESLTLPKDEVLRLPKTQSLIYSCMFDGSMISFPPPVRYRFRVLKKIVGALEAAIEDPEEDEISNDLSECMALYMANPLPDANAAAQQKSYVTYTAPSLCSNAPSVTLLESQSLLASSGTTGFRTWEAALYLASYLFSAEAKHLTTDQSVLELGAGTGFLSIFAAAHLGARYVSATDGNTEIVHNMKDNLGLNGLGTSDSISSAVLSWGHALIGGVADCREKGRAFDLILGADVTYDIHSMPALVATLRDLFELYTKTRILISATIRNKDTLAAFLDTCAANSFSTQLLRSSDQSELRQIGFFHPTSTPISIFEITMLGEVKDPFIS